jgi:hypothetical protein
MSDQPLVLPEPPVERPEVQHDVLAEVLVLRPEPDPWEPLAIDN